MLPRSPEKKNPLYSIPHPSKIASFWTPPPRLEIPVASEFPGMELHDTYKKQMVILRGIIYNCLACQHRKSMTSRKTRNYYF